MNSGGTIALFVMLASGAAWGMEVNSLRYQCARGVMVPATYLLSEADAVVVLHVEGAQITLFGEAAASGARYGWPSDGSNYVWLTKEDSATLLWRDGSDQSEAVILDDCKALS
jgi:membrane-bound inhibitor of C-type lysozyme